MKYVTSRISKGNKLFPTEISTEENGLSVRMPGMFNDKNTFLAYSSISSVTVETPLIGFSTIYISSQGSQITIHGFSKRDAIAIRKAIEACQGS